MLPGGHLTRSRIHEHSILILVSGHNLESSQTLKTVAPMTFKNSFSGVTTAEHPTVPIWPKVTALLSADFENIFEVLSSVFVLSK